MIYVKNGVTVNYNKYKNGVVNDDFVQAYNGLCDNLLAAYPSLRPAEKADEPVPIAQTEPEVAPEEATVAPVEPISPRPPVLESAPMTPPIDGSGDTPASASSDKKEPTIITMESSVPGHGAIDLAQHPNGGWWCIML